MKFFRKLRAWLGLKLLTGTSRGGVLSGTFELKSCVPPVVTSLVPLAEPEHFARCTCMQCLLKREQALQADIAARNDVAGRIPMIRWQPTNFPSTLRHDDLKRLPEEGFTS